MKIFADKDFLPVLKRFALMGTVAFFAACGDDTSSVKPDDDDPGLESSSSEEPSSSSEDVARSSSSSLNDASSSSAKSSSSEQSSSEQSSSSSKGDTLSSGAESSSSSETDVSSSSVTLKEFPLESYTKDSFKNPEIDYQTMTDERDGHVYRIVTVGTGDSAMTWMAENLNFSENTTDSALAINLKSQTSCPFGKAESCGILGRLYTWTAAMNISEGYKDSIPSAKKIVPIRNHRGVCPAGWHVPAMSEYLSLYNRIEEKLGLSKQGIALKSKTGWDDSLSAGNDIFGLSFVPGESVQNGFLGYVWLADVDYARTNSTTRIVLETNANYTFFNGGLADWNAYVRCVKDKDVVTGKFKDSRDGKYYKYAYIGNTRWMAENLNYGNDSLGKCSWDDDENCSENGRYYTYEESRTVCPDGWRLPTENDFSELIENVGGSANAAVYLRSTEWKGDLPGINAYGFSAKPTGSFHWGKTTDNFGRVEPQLGFSSESFDMWLGSMNGMYMVTILDWSNSSYNVMGALTFNIDGVNESPLIPVRCIQ